MASRRVREWARPEEPRRDAHDCIMVRMIEMSSRSSHTEYKVVARWSPRHGRLASDCFVRAALIGDEPES